MFIERLAQYRNFVLYDTTAQDGSPDYKMPLRVADGKHASSQDPTDWVSYDEAVQFVRTFPKYGLGFVLTNSPYSCIDFDSHRTNDEKILSLHKEIHDGFESYSEWSPNGGVHVWIEGEEEGRKLSSHYLEMYSTGRYMTLTNNPLNNVPIANRQELLTSLKHKIDALRGKNGNNNGHVGSTVDAAEVMSDQQLINAATQAANGDKFVRLWAGDWRTDYSHQANSTNDASSEADLALLNILAFYTDNQNQVFRLFMQSKLGTQRDKYKQRPKLLQDMVKKAFDQKVPSLTTETMQAVSKFTASSVEVFKQHQKEEQTRVEWKEPPGLVGDIYRYIFDSSIRPVKEVSLGASLALMASVCGRGWNTVTGTGCNLYIVILAGTASGKEGASRGISSIANKVIDEFPVFKNFIGPGDIGSPQGLLRYFKDSKCFLARKGEIGYWLQKLNSKNVRDNDRELKGLLLDLFNKSGYADVLPAGAYAKKENSYDAVKSPAVTIFGDSTQQEFYKALEDRNISEGLVPRFTVIDVPLVKPPYNENASKLEPPKTVVHALGVLAKRAMELENTNSVITVKETDDARKFQLNYQKVCDDKTWSDITSPIAALWSRAHMRLLRIGALLAIGEDLNVREPVVTANHYQWAETLINHGVETLKAKFERGETGQQSDTNDQRRKVSEFILKHFSMQWTPKMESTYNVTQAMFDAKVFPYAYIQSMTKGYACFKNGNNSGFALKNVLNEFAESGALLKGTFGEGHKKGIAYQVVDAQILKVLG